MPRIARLTIDNDLATQQEGAIEVTVQLADGTRRWCFFVTPAQVLRWGDDLAGTAARIQYGTPHQIVVSAITEPVIHAALDQIQRAGELLACTLPLGEPVNLNDTDEAADAEGVAANR